MQPASPQALHPKVIDPQHFAETGHSSESSTVARTGQDCQHQQPGCPCQCGPRQQTTLVKDRHTSRWASSLDAVSTGLTLPLFLHCCGLRCIGHPREKPSCPSGRWHIPGNLLLPGVSKTAPQQGSDTSSDTDSTCSPSARRQTVAKPSLHPLPAGSTVPSGEPLPSLETPCPSAPFIFLFQFHSQSTESYQSRLLLQAYFAESRNTSPGPHLSGPSSTCASLPAHLLMPSSSSSSSQLSVCKLLLRFYSLYPQAPCSIWYPEHPYFIWHSAPPPRRAAVPG